VQGAGCRVTAQPALLDHVALDAVTNHVADKIVTVSADPPCLNVIAGRQPLAFKPTSTYASAHPSSPIPDNVSSVTILASTNAFLASTNAFLASTNAFLAWVNTSLAWTNTSLAWTNVNQAWSMVFQARGKAFQRSDHAPEASLEANQAWIVAGEP
jgi:hypothetical protein